MANRDALLQHCLRAQKKEQQKKVEKPAPRAWHDELSWFAGIPRSAAAMIHVRFQQLERRLAELERQSNVPPHLRNREVR